ncbi:hypothetical protein TNCV_5037241 [Trichonephila clavipes]|nr:hypothetical protein TNCV_5037241 [Trichonephila clavipes]
MYADDAAILSELQKPQHIVEKHRSEHLAHLEIWFSVWKIALNSTKTEAVFFSQRSHPECHAADQRDPWSRHANILVYILIKLSLPTTHHTN